MRLPGPGTRLAALALTIFAAATARGQEQELIQIAGRTSTASLDSTLPDVPFERWLRTVAGDSAVITWEVNDCGEGGDGNSAPTCVEAIVKLKGDTSAHASIAVLDPHGKRVPPATWDLWVGTDLKPVGYRNLNEWAERIRARRQ